MTMEGTSYDPGCPGKPKWTLFLSSWTVFFLMMRIWGLPPALGSTYQIGSQWPRSSVIAAVTFCLLIASCWNYRRPGFVFKMQALTVGLTAGTVFFMSAYSAGNSLRYLKFRKNMELGYEVKCGKLYALYASSDIEHAKGALQDVINYSLAERDKARYYWRFNIIIARAEARLAAIADSQGNNEEAERLFALASDYKWIGDEACRKFAREEGSVDLRSFDEHPITRRTPDQWRKILAVMDKDAKWRSSNNKPQPKGAAS